MLTTRGRLEARTQFKRKVQKYVKDVNKRGAWIAYKVAEDRLLDEEAEQFEAEC